TTVNINMVISTKPPSISNAVSSHTVRVSSSIDLTQQAQVDLEPQVGGNAQERRVERHIHAIDDRCDHRTDLAGIGRAARFGRGEGDDQSDDGAEETDPYDMCRQPLHIRPAPQENAEDAERRHAYDHPAQERVLAGERLVGKAGDPQAN